MIFYKTYISAGPGDEDMVMEDVNIESIAAMKCPITQKPIERAAKANVSFVQKVFVSNSGCFKKGCVFSTVIFPDNRL